MLEYSAWQFGHTIQSSSRNVTGRPQNSHGSPSSTMSNAIYKIWSRGVTQILIQKANTETRETKRHQSVSDFRPSYTSPYFFGQKRKQEKVLTSLVGAAGEHFVMYQHLLSAFGYFSVLFLKRSLSSSALVIFDCLT